MKVDLPAAGRLGIGVVRVPACAPNAVAEHTIGLILTLNRRIRRAYNCDLEAGRPCPNALSQIVV